MKILTLTHRHTTKRPSRQGGFTLVELLLYLAISAIVISGVVTLLFILMGTRVKNQTINEVESQGAFIMQEIGQSVRSAGTITAPAAATTANTLTLQESDTAKNPTTYGATNGIVSVTEGKAAAVALNSPAVTVSNLSFQNLSVAGTTSQIVRVSFTVSYVNNTGRDEYSYSKTFYNSYSLR